MRTHLLLVLAAAALAGPTAVQAGPLPERFSPHPDGARDRGLSFPRLSAPERDRWAAVVGIVFAEDERGRPLHPTLRGLWERVAARGHDVRIELTDELATAGSFHVERWDPRGERHVAVIQLNLDRIDRGLAKPDVGRTDGFVPLVGLSREQRYAEVLGHELAHAVWDLATPARARLGIELRQGQEQLTQAIRESFQPGQPFQPAIRRRMARLEELRWSLERPADALESVVWRELAGRGELRDGDRLAAADIDSLWPPVTAGGSAGTTPRSVASARPPVATTSSAALAR